MSSVGACARALAGIVLVAVTLSAGLGVPEGPMAAGEAAGALRLVQVVPAQDTYLRDGAPNQSQSAEPLLRIRAAGRNRALVDFDNGDLAAALAGNLLVAAHLELKVQTNGGNWGDGRAVDAHRLTEPWIESAATWNCAVDPNLGNHQPDCSAAWDGGSFEPAVTASVLHANDLAGWVRFDVTADVEAALAGAPFHGWLLKKAEEGAPGWVDYSSREVCGEEPRLVLEVEAPGPDTEPPRLEITSPADRFLINQPAPALAVSFVDAGSPVDLSSLSIELDGADLTSNCTVCSASATCPSPELAEGNHTLNARLRDAAGNLTTQSFIFDLLLGDGAHRLTLPVVADTYLRDGAPNQSQGTDTLLRIRSSRKNRALVRFDLAGVEDLVDDLHSATLELFVETNGNNWGTSGRAVGAHALGAAWSEAGATWNCPADSNPANSQPDCSPQWNGGNFDAAPTDTLLVTNGLIGWVSFDVTADLLEALSGGEHHGWLLKKAAENQSGLVEFTSNEGTPGQAARLVLAFDGGEEPDTGSPSLTITAPAEGALFNHPAPEIAVAFADDASGVDVATLATRLDGIALAVSCSFTEAIASCMAVELLPEGAHVLSATIADHAGNVSAPAAVHFVIDTVAPAPIDPGRVTVTVPSAGAVSMSAPAASAEPGAELRVTNLRTGGSISVTIAADGSFGAALPAETGDRLSLVAVDAAGNESAATEVVVPQPPDPDLPPDPSTVAPPLDRSVATDLFTATEFLYTGAHPIQTGVAPGTIEARRVAVVRGRVLDRSGDPLPGVEISIHRHLELGRTKSRADGAFDLAVNGGSVLTIDYSKEGFLPIQRQVKAPWQDYTLLDDVNLLPLDPVATVIQSGSPAAQVARGTPQMDADGTRRATLVFPAATAASMLLEDGTSQPLTRFTVRATEYTVGPQGPAAMPGPLPPNVAYTYAVELSADEAIAAGALRVELSQPAYVYVENFLDFPVGEAVPMGYYDRQAAAWIGADNGRVIAILGVDSQGRAEIDLDGSGEPAHPVDLEDLGFTDGERLRLGELYSAGQSLWRSPIPHFTPWDHNFPFAPPDDAEMPPADDLPDEGRDEDKDPCAEGSVIGCNNQTLGERLEIVGTPFELRYQSARMPGRTAAYTLPIRITDDTVPASLKRVELAVSVAGRVFRRTFAPLPDQTYTFVWDGKDAYGRRVQGSSPFTLKKSFLFDLVYMRAAGLERSWARFSGSESISDRTRVGGEVELSREQYRWVDLEARGTLGAFDAQALGFGGWTLDVHQVYDPTAQALHLGSGERRSAHGLPPGLYNSVGIGEPGYEGDGGAAPLALLTLPAALTFGEDGSLYLADQGNHAIRRVDPRGIITTIAGNGTACEVVDETDPSPCGEGILATEARLRNPGGVAVRPGGEVLIADTGNGCVREVDLAGIIRTVAGSCDGGGGGSVSALGQAGPPGAPQAKVEIGCDECPGTAAELRSPRGLALTPDGGLFIADFENDRVRHLSADGWISTFAGGGAPAGDLGDGGPAGAAYLSRPAGLALGRDGSLFIAQPGEARVRRVRADGIITTVAGNGVSTYCGDSQPATQACISFPVDVAVAPDGSLLIADSNNRLVRKVSPNGVMRTIAGRPEQGDEAFEANGTAAGGVDLDFVASVAVAPDGAVVFGQGAQVLRLSGAFQGFTGDEIVIPERDGGSAFVFDRSGRHLRTVDALTGVVLLELAYDSAGLVSEVRDRDGKITRIERGGAGLATAIVGPFGQRSELQHSAGYLARFRNPALESTELTYSADGLLETMTDPRGGVRSYSFAGLGRLIRAEDPAGGEKTLLRTNTQDGHRVELTSPLGRVTEFEVSRPENGAATFRRIDPSGGLTEEVEGRDGKRSLSMPDGTRSTVQRRADPRWGLTAAIPGSIEIETPSGLKAQVSGSRGVVLSDPEDPLSVEEVTERLTVNGETYLRHYDAATRRLTASSPEGRTRVTQLDAAGRPVEITRQGLASIEMTYDALGRPSAFAQGAGAERRTLGLSYDPLGRLASLTDAMGRVLALGYDAADRVSALGLPGGRSVALGYDGNDNPTSLTPPGRPAHLLGYSPVDLLASYQAPPVVGSATTAYLHDRDRQPTEVAFPSGSSIDFAYDVAGRLASLSTPQGPTTFSYLPDTRQLATVAVAGETLAYTYDGLLLKSTAWSGQVTGRIDRDYDANFRLAEERLNGSSAIDFAFDRDGLLIQAGDLHLTYDAASGLLDGTTLGAVAGTLSRNNFGELSGYQVTHGGSPLLELEYTRDALGRIAEKIETIAGAASTYRYSYDFAGRLARAERAGAVVAEYTYDANGNRLSYAGTFGTAAGSYDDQDRLVTYGETTYGYTAEGSLSSKSAAGQTATYEYDLLGSLRSVGLPSGIQIEYVLDGRGRRVGKRVNGALVQGFLYRDSLAPAAELDGGGAVRSRFVYGSRSNAPDYMVKEGVTYAVVADHLGSPRLIVDTSTGAVAQRLDYDEFGRVILDTNPGFQPFGFAGGIYDHQTGLVRFGARDYDPEAGRWTARDPSRFLGGTANLYSYSFNDPVNFHDPEGQVAAALAVPIVAAVAAVAIYELWLTTPAGQDWIDGIARDGLPPLVMPRIGPWTKPGAPGRLCPKPTAIPGERPRATPPPPITPGDPEDNLPPEEKDLWKNEGKKDLVDKLGDFVDAIGEGLKDLF